MRALILEIANKHDHISSLRVKNRKLEGRVEELERKVQFREKIIRELRRNTKCQAQVEKKNDSSYKVSERVCGMFGLA